LSPGNANIQETETYLGRSSQRVRKPGNSWIREAKARELSIKSDGCCNVIIKIKD
jgi:hypothetical protein